jgi:nucleoside-triphosphatase THEP1
MTFMKRVLLLMGTPGVGKTTVIIKTVDALKAKGMCLCGMISREVREDSGRVGFEILDFLTHLDLNDLGICSERLAV